jgi:hypothetical protein
VDKIAAVEIHAYTTNDLNEPDVHNPASASSLNSGHKQGHEYTNNSEQFGIGNPESASSLNSGREQDHECANDLNHPCFNNPAQVGAYRGFEYPALASFR